MPYGRERAKQTFRPKPGKLLDQVREVLRYHHYSIRTEDTYVRWIPDYIRFNGTRHPREMGKPEIERFLIFSRAFVARWWRVPWVQGARRKMDEGVQKTVLSHQCGVLSFFLDQWRFVFILRTRYFALRTGFVKVIYRATQETWGYPPPQ